MITLQQARQLKPGDILHCNKIINRSGEKRRYKVNGQIKIWKRSPTRVKVPLKFGLYIFDELTEHDFVNGVCNFMDLEP